MEAHHQMLRIQQDRDVHQIKQQVHLTQAAASSPSSASTSPSHEFSFTISLASKISENKSKSSPPQIAAAIDLSPADEIFFHGHLLPLHLLSHLPVSPRSSTNSLDSFTLPIKELSHNDGECMHVAAEEKTKGKSKSFSLFAMPKWRKRGGGGDEGERKGKSKLELLKRYARFVKLFLNWRRRRGKGEEFVRQQAYSYSGNIRVRDKRNLVRGRRGEFSAPATMRTSPANSGVLVVGSGCSTPTMGKSDSTMEELQAAIQAAIAHCKNSIAADQDEVKLPP